MQYDIQKVIRSDDKGVRKPAAVEAECKKLEADGFERFEANKIFFAYRRNVEASQGDDSSDDDHRDGEAPPAVEATEPAQVFARSRGIDLANALADGSLVGSGDGGRVTKRDVEELVKKR